MRAEARAAAGAVGPVPPAGRRDGVPPGDGRLTGWTVGLTVARRAARSGAAWGAVFGLYIVSSVAGFVATFPTRASQLRFAASLQGNRGLEALLGPARRIDTVAGYTAWRAVGVLTLVGAPWALLAGTRLLRGEEDAGRWELLLAGPTTRRRAAAQGVAGLAAGWLALWAVTAVIAEADGATGSAHFGFSASLFLSVTLTASAALFLAIGALAGQLAGSRRQAASLAAAVLGVAFLVRMVADSGAGLEWLRWLSPLGWIEGLHPLTGSRPWMLVPVVALTVAAGAASVAVAGVRDLGGTVIPARDHSPPHTRLLGGPTGLAVRLARPVAAGWIAGVGVGGLFFGLVAQSAANAVSGSAAMARDLARLGAHRQGAATYLGLTFFVVASLIAVVAAGQLGAAREEEASGRLDHLLVAPVGRLRWLAGRLATALVVVGGAGLVAGLMAWVGAASQHSGVGFASLLAAGLNTVPPAVFVLGSGTLVLAVAPRLTSAAAYGLVAWSFLVELIGALVRTNRWILDTSVLYHVAPAPATNPHWGSAAVLVGLGVVAAAAGAAGFRRRDLANA